MFPGYISKLIFMNTIILAAAFGKNYELGTESGAPLWNLPDEYNRFRESIRSFPIIIGRKSFDVIRQPLEDSLNIVVTHRNDYNGHGALVVHSIEEAIAAAKPAEKIYIIGGGDIFKMAMDFADRMEISRIDKAFTGANAFFPRFSTEKWKLISNQRHEIDERHAYAFDFEVWERIYNKS